MSHVSTRVWVLLSWVSVASSACGPGEPWVPADPDPECATDGDCPAPDECQTGVCNRGRCVLEPAAVGAPCDDGLFCSEGEVCDGRGTCGGGSSPCREYVPGIPRCNEAERMCEICTDGRALVNGECRCPFWNCVSRGGATYCAETDQSEENQTACYYDGLTVDDLPALGVPDRE